jgi:predicted component of type VI protein secretion system
MSDLNTIENQIVGGGDGHPLIGRHLLRVVRQLRQQFGQIDNRFAADETQAALFTQQTNDRLTTVEQRTLQTVSRVTALENLATITITAVATLADLPAEASSRRWFRVVGDPAVYIGNGVGQPLTKLVPA